MTHAPIRNNHHDTHHNNHDPRIGVALSGGGTRGSVHVGVLQALEDNGIVPAYLSGTSAGAFVAALYAFGIPLFDLRKIVIAMTPMRTVHFTLSRFGLLTNDAIGSIVDEVIGKRNIEDAPIPLAVMAADICTGEKVVLRSGSVSAAVMASSALPGISVPVTIGGRMLVDGFIVEDVPISPLRPMGADIVVAVNLCSEQTYKTPEDLIDVLRNAFDIAIDKTTQEQMLGADILIEPKVASFSRNDNSGASSLIAEGYRATASQMETLRLSIEQHRHRRVGAWWQSLLHPSD